MATVIDPCANDINSSASTPLSKYMPHSPWQEPSTQQYEAEILFFRCQGMLLSAGSLEKLTNTSQVIAHELSNTLVTLRVSNVYDLSSKIFLVKFAKPDHKQQIIIDSGFRCHLTDYSRGTAAAPSPFVTRLRKYLKTRRVTAVSQVGTDRIIEFQSMP